MRSSFFERFGSRLKSPLLVFLALFLSLSALLNLVPAFLHPAYAEKCTSGKNCYFVSLTSEDGKETIIGRSDNSGFAPTDGQLNVAVIYRITYDTNNSGRRTVDVSTPGWSSSQLNDATDNWSDNAMVDIRVVDSETDLFYVKRVSYKQLESKYWKQKLKISNSDKKVLKTTTSSLFGPASVIINNLDNIEDEGAQVISTGADETNQETVLSTTDIDSAETDETTTGTVGDNVTDQYDPNTNANGSSSSDPGTTTGDITCSKGTSGLGWILCSIGEMVSNLLNTLYEHFIVPALQIRATLFEGQNGTYAVWATFRDIANVLFVIYFLVIIFSQLTGVGIDNYGIKKSLPRLIVAAILINLSYFICQLVIDLSNIVGASLYGFLQNVPIGDGYKEFLDSLVESDIVSATVGSTSNLLVYVLATAFVLGGIWSIGGVAALGSMAVVPVLSGLIGAAVSIFFMFVLLSFRNAVVVIGVAISPLAFVCYMLPNTKNLYDRWFQIMKGMILLYPICSVVIGGGHLASRIILGSGGANADIFLLISAIVAEVAPYFAVPSLVRAAYKATGRLGMRLERMSMIAPRRAQMGFRRSQFAQNTQDWSNRITTNRRMQRRIDRLGGRTNLSDAQRRRLAEANQYALNQEKEQQAARALTDTENVAALRHQQQVASEAQLTKNQEYARQLGLEGAGTPTGEQITVNGANITADSLREATIQQAVINQEGQLKGTSMFENGDYVDLRRHQQDAAVSNETTKAYVDQLSRQGKTDWEDAFRAAVSGVDGAGNAVSNRTERLRATIQVMSASGATDSIMGLMKEADAGSGQTYGELLSATMRGNTQLRNDIISSLSATKSANLMNYAKHLGAAGSAALSYEKYMDNSKATSSEMQALATAGLGTYNAVTNTFTSNSKYTSMTETMNAKGKNAFDSMDKDDLADYFGNASVSDINRINSEAYMRALTTKTDEEISKLDKGLESLYNTKKADIRSKASGQFITDAKDSSLDKLRTQQTSTGPQLIDREIAYANPIRQVKSNPQLLTHWSTQRQTDYNFSSVL